MAGQAQLSTNGFADDGEGGKMTFVPRHILITGGAGAIGGALGAEFRARWKDVRITLVDRDRPSVEAKANALDAHAEVCNLTDIDALPGWWKPVTAQNGEVDLLVNCAGIMDIMSFTGTGWERGRQLLDINLTAPLRLMDLALPNMIANRSGAVVNVASMAGRVPIPGCSYYGGAKAGIAQASEIARMDLAAHGVDVITVYPGPIYSGLESHARSQVQQGIVARYLPTGRADELAKRILVAYDKREPRVIYPDFYNVANHIANLTIASWLLSRISPQPKG
jgi:short-subunit dehydrogenase